MIEAVKVTVTGVDEVRRQLDAMVNAVRADAIADALDAAAQPIIQSAKSKAPGTTIPPGIGVVNVKKKAQGEVIIEIGLPGGRRPWFYGLFVELGTGPRKQKTTGRLTGSMPAQPFLRPAFDEQAANAERIFGERLRQNLEEVAARG